MTNKGSCAFVTLATDDNYGTGTLVLANSLRLVGTKAKIVVLVTSGVSNTLKDKLNKTFDLVEDVSTMDSRDIEKLAMLKRPELGVTFTKLHCWRLTQFSKCVFLDADTLVLKNCDELFDKDELSAVPDVGWPDCFNSGMFVFKPSNETFNQLTQMASEEGSFDGGDQGLLNTYFSDWATKDIARHLSFIYNMNANTSYTYLPAFKKFGKNVKIVHFLGTQKPWMYTYNKITGSVEAPKENNPTYEFLRSWWKIFLEYVAENKIETTSNSVTKSMSKLTLGQQKGTGEPTCVPEPNLTDETDRRYAWEQGRIDYMGQDSYDNIQKKLDESINGVEKKKI